MSAAPSELHHSEWDFDHDEWDPQSVSFPVHMTAGSMGGLMEHCFMFPLDTIKTYMQSPAAHLSTKAPAMFVARKLIREEGAFRLWRGMTPMVAACIPAHSLYFSIFEYTKQRLGGNAPGHHPVVAALSASLGTSAHDAVMVPFDVCKQRLQLGLYGGFTDAVRTIVRTEGVSALWASFSTTLLMNIPYAAVMVSMNESLKLVLNPGGQQNLPAFLLSGALAGACAATVTCPMDVVKTRLQTQSVDVSQVRTALSLKDPCPPLQHSHPHRAAPPTEPPQRARGLLDAVRAIYKEEGMRGFFRGVKPRVLFHTPSVAICWSTYETMKRILGPLGPEPS